MTLDEYLDKDLSEDTSDEVRRHAARFPTPSFYERDVSWHNDAVCAQTDPEMFFPDKGGSTREAKRVCRTCVVRAECLQYALDTDQRFGIWGNASERERRRLAKLLQGGGEAA